MNPEDELQRYGNIESFMSLAATMSAQYYKALKKEGIGEPEASRMTGVFVAEYLNAPLADDST